MKCKKVKKLLDLYIEKELSPQVAEEVAGHLNECELCRAELVYWNKIYYQFERSVSPPHNFTQSVMNRLAGEKVSEEVTERESIFGFIFQWRTLRWSFSGLAVIILLLLSPLLIKHREMPGFQEKSKLTAFTLFINNAQTVSLVGDFNSWEPSECKLSDPDGDGTWTVEVPLKPGRYQYGFIVDGSKWATDPDAERYAVDGFGSKNAIVKI